MKPNISANTDIGIHKKTNQDSYSVMVVNTPSGRLTLVVLCDGMGGLKFGEIASAEVIRSFDKWARFQLPDLCKYEIREDLLFQQWSVLLRETSRRVFSYGERNGFRLGTTVVAALFTRNWIYVTNVGDSRMYEIYDCTKLLTRDHSLVWREVEAGRLSYEQAKHHPKRNVLTQSIGGKKSPVPDFYKIPFNFDACYMFCSDGFHHELTDEEIWRTLNREKMVNEGIMNQTAEALIDLVKARGEADNISVILICYEEEENHNCCYYLRALGDWIRRHSWGKKRGCVFERFIHSSYMDEE